MFRKYINAHANFVGHYVFVSKRSFATYLCIAIFYSFALACIYTIFTANREDAILNVFLFLFPSQVNVLIRRFESLLLINIF